MEKTEEIKKYLKFQRKLRAIRLAQDLGYKCACEVFKMSKTNFYNYDTYGEEGLWRKKRDSSSYWNSIDKNTIELILDLREQYKLGTWRIKWYLERYHDINVSEATVYRTLRRHNVKPFDRTSTRHAMGPKRYSKQTPGHHVQVDVKFLTFNTDIGKVRRFQYTEIEDCTRIRAIKIYKKHNQDNEINFIDYVVDKFPFRIHAI